METSLILDWLGAGITVISPRKLTTIAGPLKNAAWKTLEDESFPFGNIWVFPKIMVPPNYPFVHRVFHYCHHPFWGFSPYFWKHPYNFPFFIKKHMA